MSESESESDYENETPLSDIDDEFKKAILDVKYSLYSNIIIGPAVGTEAAQSLDIIHKYLECLNKLYDYAFEAQNGNTSYNLDIFPHESKGLVTAVLHSISEFFKKNTNVADRIPYENYILNSFKKYQFVLNENFED